MERKALPSRIDRTRAIEKALANVYVSLFNEIKKSENYPDNIPLIQFNYKRKVYDASRKAITQVFQEGHNYVGRQLNVETYQSDSDTAMIKEETDKATSMFWSRLTADAERQILIRTQQQRKEVAVEAEFIRDKQQFDTDFYLQNAASITTTGALAISTLSKTNQLVTDPELAPIIIEDKGKPKITWRTMSDEKVCQKLPNGNPGCFFLDGQEWDYDDPEIPVPGRLGPNGTHPECRCWLELG